MTVDQDQKGIRCFVSGRVQGVFYRAKTQQIANELGLTGWVRNLPDGRVEVLAFGSQQQLKELTDWLWHGPTLAKVTSVDVISVEFEVFQGFEVV